jgi:hypothetical protein
MKMTAVWDVAPCSLVEYSPNKLAGGKYAELCPDSSKSCSGTDTY